MPHTEQQDRPSCERETTTVLNSRKFHHERPVTPVVSSQGLGHSKTWSLVLERENSERESAKAQVWPGLLLSAGNWLKIKLFQGSSHYKKRSLASCCQVALGLNVYFSIFKLKQ